MGGVLLLAAWSKSLDPASFADEVRTQGLDFLLSGETVALIALALEWFLGAALVLAIRRWWILLPTSALVAFFLALTGRTYWRASRGLRRPKTPAAAASATWWSAPRRRPSGRICC